jgi:D-aspartate ligase
MQHGNLSDLRRLPRRRLPVVLLGGLNVARALGLAGIPVVVACSDDEEPALFSRYCTAIWRLPPLRQAEAVCQSLESLAARLRAIYPCSVPLFFSNDDYLRFVNAHRERLEARFRMLLNEEATTLALLDKDRFARFASERGLPVPRDLSWETLATHAGPVLVKPATKQGWEARPALAELFEGNKARVWPDGATARAEAALARVQSDVVLSEYIEGGDTDLWCFDGVADEHGEVMASHVGRKLRCSPPLTGDSSYIELVDEPQLQRLGREIARAIPLRGIFNMDLKRDPATGRFYLLEINARCNLWLYIGARNGMNLAKVFYEYLVRGDRPREMRYRARYRWIDFKLDRAAYRALASAGRTTFPGWIASLCAPKVYSVFAWRDPGPFIAMLLHRVRRRAKNAGVPGLESSF